MHGENAVLHGVNALLQVQNVMLHGYNVWANIIISHGLIKVLSYYQISDHFIKILFSLNII